MGDRPRVSLELLEIRNPCPVRWEDMRGDARVRYCRHCDLNVYNLSAMRRDDAERFVAEHEGRRLCGMMYRRQDGTVITADCEGAWRMRARQVGHWTIAAAAVVLAAVVSPFATAVTPERMADGIRRTWSIVTRPWAILSSRPSAPPMFVSGEFMPPRAMPGDVAFPAMAGAIAPISPTTQPGDVGDDAGDDCTAGDAR